MKTNFKLTLVALLTAGLLNSCTVMGDTIKPSKNNITREYKVKEFNAINASTVGDIYYTQSTDGKTSVQIYGADNIIELVRVSVKENQLTLDMEKYNNIRNAKLKITISTPELNDIDFKGVGDIIMMNPVTTAKLTIDSKGVGDIKIENLTCDEITVNSKGVGDIKLKGKAESAILSSQGVGNIEAEEFEATHIEAYSKGVGNISCRATESLKASAKGVGSIKYKGDPTKKEFKVNGVGSIKQM